MSFLTKWFSKTQKAKSKPKQNNTSSDDDYIMSDEDNVTISHSVLSFDALQQIEQLHKKQQKQFEQLNVCRFICRGELN
jgi:hypothetical protein